MPFPRRPDACDAIVAMLLFAAVVAYLALLPHNLGYADESFFLYEGKRIRDGDLMYRDFFQFVTPLSFYAMAALFRLFGTTMTTARASMAVLHGLTGVVLYATARRLGVRRELAALVVLAYLAVCHAVWPFASPHWFATLAFAVLALVMIAGPWAQRPRSALLPGVVTGIAIGIQQQKGVLAVAGVCLVFAIDHLLSRRDPAPEPRRRLAIRLACFAAGVGLVVVPLLGIFVALAGFEPVYAALVRFPLENYRSHLRIEWGQMGALGASYGEYTFPRILRYSPVALALPALACLTAVRAGRDRQRVRELLVLTVLSACAVLSVWYYPDFIHIAFIAASLWLCAAVGAEWMLAAVRPPALGRLIGALLVVGIAARLAVHMVGYVRQLRAAFPIAHDTAFGRVDFTARWQPLLVDHVRGLLAATPDREIYCYPSLVSMYLLTGGRNPTPYQFLVPAVSPERQTRETLAILEARRVPYVITWPALMRPGDPIARFLADHYQPLGVPEIAAAGEQPRMWLLVRKDRAQPAPPAGG